MSRDVELIEKFKELVLRKQEEGVFPIDFIVQTQKYALVDYETLISHRDLPDDVFSNNCGLVTIALSRKLQGVHSRDGYTEICKIVVIVNIPGDMADETDCNHFSETYEILMDLAHHWELREIADWRGTQYLRFDSDTGNDTMERREGFFISGFVPEYLFIMEYDNGK